MRPSRPSRLLTWRACGWIQGDGPALRARLAPWLGRYDYAVVLPAAVGGARLQLGAADAPTARRWRNCWMPWNCVVRTPPSTIRRAACWRLRTADGAPAAFLLTGDLRAQDALLAWAGGDAAPASPPRC